MTQKYLGFSLFFVVALRPQVMRCFVLLTMVLGVLALSSSDSFADSAALPPSLDKLIRKNGIPPHRVGLFIKTLGENESEVSYNPDKPYNPASVIKLLVTFAALDLLGPTHKWKTSLYHDGVLEGDTLKGNLYLKGSGDPSLVWERFRNLINELHVRGLRKIEGSFVIDDTLYDIPHHDPGKFDGASLKPYNVGASGVLLNFKAVKVVFAPDFAKRSLAIYTEPPSESINVVNNMTLSTRSCRNWRGRISERLIPRDDGSLTMRFGGKYPARCGVQSFYVAVQDHAPFVAGVFASAWKSLGGEFSGDWRNGEVPKNAKLLASSVSDPLSKVVVDINKFSNNPMARMVFLALSEKSGEQAVHTADLSASRIVKWMEKQGIATEGFSVENGSGLSRDVRITPRQLAEVLDAAWHHPLRAELVSSLPITGVDGTMRRRYLKHDLAGLAHMKTGSLNGVRAVAGYLKDDSGRDVLFVLMINWAKTWQSSRFMSELLAWAHKGDGL